MFLSMYSVYIDIDNSYILIISAETLKFNLLKFNYFFQLIDIYVIWHYKKYTFYKRYLEVVFNSFNLKKLQDDFHC